MLKTDVCTISITYYRVGSTSLTHTYGVDDLADIGNSPFAIPNKSTKRSAPHAAANLYHPYARGVIVRSAVTIPITDSQPVTVTRIIINANPVIMANIAPINACIFLADTLDSSAVGSLSRLYRLIPLIARYEKKKTTDANQNVGRANILVGAAVKPPLPTIVHAPVTGICHKCVGIDVFVIINSSIRLSTIVANGTANAIAVNNRIKAMLV